MSHRATRTVGLFLFLSLLGGHTMGLAAQQPSRQSTTRGRVATFDSSGGGTYSISGRVFDRATNQPIDEARVVLTMFTGAYLEEIYVDATGYYIFSDLRPTTYVVIASHPGYEDVRMRMEVSNTPLAGIHLYLPPKPRTTNPVFLEPLDVADHQVPEEAQQLYRQGVALADAGKLREALEQFDKALEIYSDYVTAWHAKGLAHLRLNEPAKARAAFERAIAINPNAAPPRILLGHILNNMNQFQGALEHLLGAVLLSRENWRVHFELSRAYMGLGEVDKAERGIVRAHELNPQALDVHLMRANLYFARQDFNGALEEMDHYLELAPDGPRAAEVRRRRQQLADQMAARQP